MAPDPSPGDAWSEPPDLVARLRGMCLALPEVDEEQAWVGTRWRVRTKTFAHVLMIATGWPPAYARAAADDGPLCVLMFRARGEELARLRRCGRPYFAPPWRADEVGVAIDDSTDWDEIAELVRESYRIRAPRRLTRD
jgi:hypothetical protein